MDIDNTYIAFTIPNHEVENFLAVLEKHSMIYNRPDPFMEYEEYIEVDVPDIPKGVAAIYDVIGDEGRMEVTYFDSEKGTIDKLEKFVSEKNMGRILKTGIIIGILGTIH